MFRFESCEFFCEGRSSSKCRSVSEEDKGSDTQECADTCRESSCALYAERIVHLGGEEGEDGLSSSEKWSTTMTITVQQDVRLTPTTLRTNDMAERAEEASNWSGRKTEISAGIDVSEGSETAYKANTSLRGRRNTRDNS